MSYLKPNRLGDVIAALQVMGSNERAEAPIESWARRFDDQPDDAAVGRWRAVFREHPEFFKIYDYDGQEKAALRWRYARRFFDHKKNKELTPEEAAALSDGERRLLTGRTLTDAQLQGLIETAIELYAKALTARQDKRWWFQIIVPAIFSLLGVVVGALAAK